MLIGEAPGGEEEATGRPFIGTAGRILNECLAVAGYSREELYISNAVKCRPPGNRTPSVQESSACFAYLAEEIDQIQPKVILCLGGAALKSLTGKDGIAGNRGRLVAPKPNVRIGDAKIFVTYHPAAITHNRNAQEQKRIREAISQDLRLAFEMSGDKRSKPKDHKKYLLAPGYSAADLTKGLDMLAKCKVLACDLEWSAMEDRQMCWPWTKGAVAYSVALSGRLNGSILSMSFAWPPPAEAMTPLRHFFAEKPMVYHNALADLNWLYQHEIPVKLAGDTLVLAFLMDEQQRLSLDQLAPLYTDVSPGWKIGPWFGPPTTEDGWLEMLDYNANDTYATLKLAEALHEKLEKIERVEQAGIKRIYYNLLLPVIPAMVDMALVGIPMNTAEVGVELQKSLVRTEQITGKIAEIIGCNARQAASLAGSPTQTLDFLQRAYGLEIDSSRKDDLVGYDDNYPVVGLIQNYRWERNKVQGTYLGPWYDLLTEQGDSRLHSVYRLTYARTGRTSAEIEKGGSLQLMPRNADDRELRTRDLVEARPGWKIVAADYSQVELRIAAWLAGEKRMIEFFRNGEDLHRMTAAYIKASREQHMTIQEFLPNRKRWMDNVTYDERQAAKGVNFGFLYGQQVDGFIAYAKQNYKAEFTLAEGAQARTSYFSLYADLEPWHKRCAQQAYQLGYTTTPFGRYRRNIEDANQAINTPVQTTASDLALLALTAISKAFKEYDGAMLLCGFVHDSVLCEVKDEFVHAGAALIKDKMENPNLKLLGVSSIPVPLKADIAVGQSWGTAKELNFA